MTQPYKLDRLTQPDMEPVTLTEMKNHLRVDDDWTTDDTKITGLIKTARLWYEQETYRALIDQQWQQSIQNERHPAALQSLGLASIDLAKEIILQRSPVLEILAFVTVSADGTEVDVDETAYRLDDAGTKWPRLVLLTGFSSCAELRIRFRAGFANRTGSPQDGAEKVPETAKDAMKLYAEALYDRDKDSMNLLIDTATMLAKQESACIGIA